MSEGSGELVDIVRHELDIVVEPFGATNGWRENQNLRAGLAGDEIRHLAIVERLHDDDLRAGLLDRLNEAGEVRRRRRNAWLRLHEADDVHAGVFREVAP